MINTSNLIFFLRKYTDEVGDMIPTRHLRDEILSGKFEQDIRYEGFRNYQTFLVARWIDNNEKELKFWQLQAKQNLEINHSVEYAKGDLASMLENHFEEKRPEQNDSIWNVLLISALEAVDWIGLAEHYVAQVDATE